MTTMVVRIVRCDSCGTEARAPSVTSMPSGWHKFIEEGLPERHICSDCVKRVLPQKAVPA